MGRDAGWSCEYLFYGEDFNEFQRFLESKIPDMKIVLPRSKVLIGPEEIAQAATARPQYSENLIPSWNNTEFEIISQPTPWVPGWKPHPVPDWDRLIIANWPKTLLNVRGSWNWVSQETKPTPENPDQCLEYFRFSSNWVTANYDTDDADHKRLLGQVKRWVKKYARSWWVAYDRDTDERLDMWGTRYPVGPHARLACSQDPMRILESGAWIEETGGEMIGHYMVCRPAYDADIADMPEADRKKWGGRPDLPGTVDPRGGR